MYASDSDFTITLPVQSHFMNTITSDLSGNPIPVTFEPNYQEIMLISLLRVAPDIDFGVLTLTRRFLYFACTENKLCNQTKQAKTNCVCNDSALFVGHNYWCFLGGLLQ